MGGSIEGHNRAGGGAVFTVRLPLHGSDTEGYTGARPERNRGLPVPSGTLPQFYPPIYALF